MKGLRSLSLILLISCGRTTTSGSDEPSPRPTAPAKGDARTSSSGSCPWRNYQPPPGCYVADEGSGRTVEDAETFVALLQPYPPETNRPPCDVDAEAAALDFSQNRLYIGSVPDADGVAPPEPIRVECSADATRVVVSVDRWCGGTERGPGRLMAVVPAGATPVELVNEGRPDCSGEPIVP